MCARSTKCKIANNNMLMNPFEQKGGWYKANLHTHTTTSDGEASVAERVQQYRKRGYSVLAITDHEKTNDVSGLSTKDLLVLGGIEIHPPCEDGNIYHLVCLNVPADIDIPKNLNANGRIAVVKKFGGEVIFGHPYWCGHNINHLLRTQGYIAMEVFNATCSKIGKGISSVHWDDLLDAGKAVPAVASDDTHRGRDIFMGWTMIKAQRLTVEAVMKALRTGCYYASCGPTIKDFRIKDGKAVLRCSPVSEAHFMGNAANGCSLYADESGAITKADFHLNRDLKYVRAEVVDRDGKRAWTNPLFHGGNE